MRFPRNAGVLAHPTSFPGRYGIGDLGGSAYHFVDFLVKSRQSLWQILPLGPTGYGDSPYQSFSAFAGNPLLISPDKCVHEINGVKYFEYVLGSDDFKQRVAKSKFGRMPLFARFDKGYLALQGDHGQVSFRNIKIRPIQRQK